MKKVKDINKVRAFKELSRKERKEISGGATATGRNAINLILDIITPYIP